MTWMLRGVYVYPITLRAPSTSSRATAVASSSRPTLASRRRGAVFFGTVEVVMGSSGWGPLPFHDVDQFPQSHGVGVLLDQVPADTADDVSVVIRPPQHVEDRILAVLGRQHQLQGALPVD